MNQRNGMHEHRGFSRNGSDRDRDERTRRTMDERTASSSATDHGRWESEGGQPRQGRRWDGDERHTRGRDDGRDLLWRDGARGIESRDFVPRDFDRHGFDGDGEGSRTRDRDHEEHRGAYYTQSREPRVYERDDRFGRDHARGRDGARTSDDMRSSRGGNDGYGTQQWNASRQGSQSYGIGSFDGGYGTPSPEKSGRAPKNYTRSDERLREDVCESLARSGHDWSDVDVQVSNGEVVLTGTVSDRSEKLHAEHLADRVRGVNDVTNQLKIKRGEARETSSSPVKDGAPDNGGSRRRAS